MNSAGSILAAAGLVPLIVGLDRRLRFAGLAAFVAGVLILAWSLLQTPIHHLTGHPAIGLAAVVVGVAGLLMGAYIILRWPWMYLLAVVATAPARVPFSVGHTDANLLVPLYLVISAGLVATAWELLHDRDQVRTTGWIGLTLTAFVGWSAISMLWSADRHHGGIEMIFFYLPFGLMVGRLAQLRPRREWFEWALIVQVVLALVFATVAFGQELTHHVFWNPGVEVENTYKSFFRVNSLFWDSSIYGRFMAVTLVLLAGVAIHRKATPWLLGIMAYVALGMYFSYSQSGYVALAIGALALGAGIWSRKITIGIVVAGSAIGVAALGVALHGSSANKVTSGRLHLWRLTRHVVENHPLAGAGMGGFSKAALAGSRYPWRVASAASHTTPFTVIAEQGPLGIVLYAGLIAATIVTAIGPGAYRAMRLVLLAAFLAILASSVFYNAFFEDPAMWIILALIVLATTNIDTPAAKEPAT